MAMVEFLYMFIMAALSLGWALLWIYTYRSAKISGYVIHTVIFSALSAAITWLMLKVIFAPVDDTYSASNKGALGLVFILWMIVFGSACLIAVFATLGKLINNRTENEADNRENHDTDIGQ